MGKRDSERKGWTNEREDGKEIAKEIILLWNPTRISATVNEHISWIQKLSEHRVLEHPEFMLLPFGLIKDYTLFYFQSCLLRRFPINIFLYYSQLNAQLHMYNSTDITVTCFGMIAPSSRSTRTKHQTSYSW